MEYDIFEQLLKLSNDQTLQGAYNAKLMLNNIWYSNSYITVHDFQRKIGICRWQVILSFLEYNFFRLKGSNENEAQ